jgi:hypothetical protein
MAIYIRADKRKYKTYYWLVESHREGEKVVQRRIRSLGTERPTGQRLKELQRMIEDLEKNLKSISSNERADRKHRRRE